MADSKAEPASLDLSIYPPIFVSATHLDTDGLHKFEYELANAGAALTYDIQEAELVLSKATKKGRIQLDLRRKGLWTKDVTSEPAKERHPDASLAVRTRKRKRSDPEEAKVSEKNTITIDDSSTASEGEADSTTQRSATASKVFKHIPKQSQATHDSESQEQKAERMVTVVKLEWFTDSQQRGSTQSLNEYVTYRGRVVEKQIPSATNVPALTPSSISNVTLSQSESVITPKSGRGILERAKEDAPASGSKVDRFGKRKFGISTPSANPASWEAGHGTKTEYAHLLHETTTEHDGGVSSDLPEMPEWVKAGVKYACQRLTPKTNPNDPFIALLKQIKVGRLLTNDEIGVRAYSTSIAALAAYNHKISNPREILALPGCDHKIANLYVEWQNTGRIQAVEELESNQDLKILNSFYDIWGVGVTTARDLYYNKGWTDRDDLIEFGWSYLSRVQQIGVKFYDEFLDLIPRVEVESICEVIREHAVRVRDDGIQTMIVGGYRRGKEACGDVDLILSHPDESKTLDLVTDLVASLEEEEWITHTLTISLSGTKREQKPLPFRTDGGGHGFDTLDKALVVWQDPSWPTRDKDLAEDPQAKNPNIHRRVDIIVAPWRSVGCAVLGWSGGTTFERDLRRYVKHEKGWKFDSSGVRDRGNGEVVDIEGFFEWEGVKAEQGRAKTMREAERRVFKGMGLEYREPWERCTG
ncbi:unnamed protein product [Zymoseptoria tritici ST99CH_1A5]|uniref:DNA polymerase n=1 Tax=Zymoseptoria tritici ST99CH_1A5 TaxID=1276529 RepID=A0A1Y6LDH8_ZYMTR|nr:unnamed protein product [Zymoseptoria tritici ST99CH_1A5]